MKGLTPRDLQVRAIATSRKSPFLIHLTQPHFYASELLNKNKNDANKCMANNLKVIPASAFYTAMPQLVSRVIHVDKDTAYVVQGILKRVLVKFPQQAMWPLAWLKGSKKPERLQIGEEIFKEAQKNLSKNHKNMEKLLQEASRLFKFLKDLAV
jgi:hypothetical protein